MIEVVLGLVRLESLLGLKVALVVRLLQLLEEDLEVPAMSTFQCTQLTKKPNFKPSQKD